MLPYLSTDPLLSDGSPLFPDWSLPWRKPSQIIPLLAVTIVLLFAPKLLALILALVRRRRQFGGTARLLLSALLEMLFAVVIAPLMMMYPHPLRDERPEWP